MTNVKLLEKSIGINNVHALESLTKASQKTHTIQTRISCSLKNVKSCYPASHVLPSKWGIVADSFPCTPSPSLWKSPQINKRHCMGSLHKQAPSRHFFALLRFDSLGFAVPGRWQTVCPALLSAEETEQRNLRPQTAHRSICKYFRARGFQNLWLSF